MSSYAIIETGSKQYRVEPKAILEVERLSLGENPLEVALEKVLFIREGEKTWVGTPYLSGARVLCDSMGELRAPKVISLKYRRRKASRRKKGHRQTLLKLRVKEIQLPK
ncbi:MAG: 50S ribosomal protein L21 [Candidatus Omnitrophica bacterium]|nr:50S ribosomal protein L21 [Candidatus Omnitrophota bacterium]